MTEERTYSSFDLLIEGAGDDGYHARVVDSPAGQATGSFEFPFSNLELENFMLKVGRPRRGVRRLESPEMEAAREFGTQLFDAVFHDELKLSLRRSLDEVERRDEGLRIRLWFSDAPELASLPWEFLFSESDDQFLVLSAWTPIVRYLDLTRPIEPLTVTGPLRILVLISSPHDFPELEVEEEWRRIERALRPLIDRGVVVIDRTEDATLVELQHRLRRNDYHIFHFLGHGGFDEKSDDGVLVLEDGNNRSRLVAGRDVGTILNDHRSLRLAVLNACEGARAGEEDPFSGVAQSLIRKGIPAVVAMQFEITDGAAIAFAQEFYGAIADGLPVDAAIGESRRAIFGQGNDIEWGTPVLFMRGDGRLFDVQANGDPPAAVAAAAGLAPLVEESMEPVPDVEPDAATDTEDHEREPDGDEMPEVVRAATAGVTVDEVVEEGLAEPAEPGPVAESPPETTVAAETVPASGEFSSPRQGLLALPMWLLWTLIAVAGVVVVVLAVNIFGGEGSTEATTAGGGATEADPAPVSTVVADDAMAVALRSAQPKVIDGNDSDWPESVFHETDHVIYTHDDILSGSVARAGEENDSQIRLAWDETYLYVFAEVQDDVLSAPNGGNQIWRNDAVNINISVIGPDRGAVSEMPDADDHQLTLSPGDPESGTATESVRFVGNGSMFSANVVGFADVAARHGPGADYVLEARIPWSEIGVTDPQSGQRFGMMVTVFDNDGEQVGGETLQTEIKANTPLAVFQRPRTWGTFTLEG